MSARRGWCAGAGWWLRVRRWALVLGAWGRLPVTPGSWAFTFAYAAAAADALVWLAITKPPGAAGYAIAVITLLTSFVSWIAFRTVVLAVRAARCRTSSHGREATRLSRAVGSKHEPQSRLARSVDNDRSVR